MHMPKNDTGKMDMVSMMMYFHLGYHEKNVLFEGWDISSIGELIGVMIAFMVLAILYEGLKAFRETVKIKELAERRKKSMNNGMLKMYGETRPLVDRVEFVRPPFLSLLRLIQAILHVLQMFMGYILMLAFMAYNAWICIAILLGGGIGHLLFTWLIDTPLSDSSDHCM